MISERAFSRSFTSFWQESLPLLTPRFMALFNEAYEKRLGIIGSSSAVPVPIAVGSRPDMVAEFAFHGARLIREENLVVEALKNDPVILSRVSKRAFEVIKKYEGRRPIITQPLTEREIEEGCQLARQYGYLYESFPSGRKIEFCPKFSGAGYINAAEGDLGVGDTLIEVKTTTRKVAGKDLRQLLIYLALDASAGRSRWSHVGIFNPRRATFHRAEISALMLRISGGRPQSDVFADLISFVESGALVVDSRF